MSGTLDPKGLRHPGPPSAHTRGRDSGVICPELKRFKLVRVILPNIRAHEEKNKNIKKVATKAPKVHSAPKIPKYEQNESGIGLLDLSSKVKKGAK